MNIKQKLQAFAVLIVVYIIAWLFFPGWKAGKILGILAGICTLIAVCMAIKAEKKK